MPAYLIEFTTPGGPVRRRFTVEPERPLGPQLQHILAELQGQGLLLAGGPEDELVVCWAGRELEWAATPARLGITPERHLELRMRRRRPTPLPVRPFAAPPARALPPEPYLAALAGASMALLAWLAASHLAGLGGQLSSYPRLDALVALLLGAATGAGARAAEAVRMGRRGWRLGRSVAGGVLLGGAGAGLAAVAASRLTPLLQGSSAAGLAGQRLVAWAVIGAGVGGGLAARWLVAAPRRLLAGLGGGALAGALAALLLALPGAWGFWQAAAFLLLGAGIGLAGQAHHLRLPRLGSP